MSCIPRIASAPSLFLILRPNLSLFFLDRTLVNEIGTFCGNCSAGRWKDRVSAFERRGLYCKRRPGAEVPASKVSLASPLKKNEAVKRTYEGQLELLRRIRMHDFEGPKRLSNDLPPLLLRDLVLFVV